MDAQSIIESVELLQKNTLSFSVLLDESGRVIREGVGIKRLLDSVVNTPLEESFQLINPASIEELLYAHRPYIRIKSYRKSIEFRCSIDEYLPYHLYLLHLTPIFTDSNLSEYDEQKLHIPNHLLVSENLFLRGGIRSGLAESDRLIDDLNAKNLELRKIVEEITKSNQYFANQHNEMTQISKWLELQNQRMNLVFASSEIIGIEISLPSNEVSLYPEEALLISKPHFTEVKSLKQLMDLVHPDFRFGLKSHLEIVNEPFNYQFLLKDENNVYRWMKFVGDHYSFGKNNNFIFGIIRDIHEEKTQENRIYEAQSFERYRISKTIHDQIGQSLIGLRFMLNQSIKKSPDDESLKEVDEILDRVIKNSRQIIQALQIDITSYDTDKEAFDYFLTLIAKVSPHKIHLHWDGEESFNNFSISFNLFMIYQELILFAIQNTTSYAFHTHLTLNETNVHLRLEDPKCRLTQEELDENNELKVIRSKTDVLNGICDMNLTTQNAYIQIYIPR